MNSTGHHNEGFIAEMEQEAMTANYGHGQSDDVTAKNQVSTSTAFSKWPTPLRQTLTYLRGALGGTKLGVHLLVCVFAISAWADLNAMWSELPVLVLEAPESWNLPSFIIVISQIANIGPLLFVVAAIAIASTSKPKLDKYTSFLIIVSDIVAVVLLSFFWKHKTYIAGQERSTALLALNFVFALGDCTSSLCFYAFMSSMKPEYMASLFLGEGLGGMLPAFIALGQGVSDINCVTGSNTVTATYPNGTEYNTTQSFVYPMFGTPRFSVQVYFVIIAVILAFSAVAFLLLNSLDYCKSEMVAIATPYDDASGKSGNDVIDVSVIVETSINGAGDVSNVASSCNSTDVITMHSAATGAKKKASKSTLKELFTLPGLPGWKAVVYVAITIGINMTLTTFLASVQTYSTLPYGLEPYHLATNLAQITNPLACFLALFVMTSNIYVIGAIFLLGEVGVAFIIYMVAESPTPPLYEESSGDVMTVGLWVAVTFLLVYTKVCVAGVMRSSGRRALIWLGAATQIGSLIGAVTGFLLVNHYEVFTSAPYC